MMDQLKDENIVDEVMMIIAEGTPEEIENKLKSSPELFTDDNCEVGIVFNSHLFLEKLDESSYNNFNSNIDLISDYEKHVRNLSDYVIKYWGKRHLDNMDLILFDALSKYLYMQLYLLYKLRLPLNQIELSDMMDKYDHITRSEYIDEIRDSRLNSFYRLSILGYHAMFENNKQKTYEILGKLTKPENIPGAMQPFLAKIVLEFGSFCYDYAMENLDDTQDKTEKLRAETENSSEEVVKHTQIENKIRIEQYDTLIFSEKIAFLGTKNIGNTQIQFSSEEHGTTEAVKISGESLTLLYFLAKEREQASLNSEKSHIPWLKNPLEHKNILVSAYDLIHHPLDTDMDIAEVENQKEFNDKLLDTDGNESLKNRILLYRPLIKKWPFDHLHNKIRKGQVSRINSVFKEKFNNPKLDLIKIHPNYPKLGIYTLADWITKVKFVSTKL